jgi:hypothetical protein
VLSDRLYRPRSAAAPLLAVMARREFPSDGSLFCQFQVFGTSPGQAGSRVVSSFELRRAGGASVRRSEPTPIEPGPDGRLVRLLGVPLAGHGQGDYELVVRVLDQATGESREAVEPLRVVSRPR